MAVRPPRSLGLARTLCLSSQVRVADYDARENERAHAVGIAIRGQIEQLLRAALEGLERPAAAENGAWNFNAVRHGAEGAERGPGSGLGTKASKTTPKTAKCYDFLVNVSTDGFCSYSDSPLSAHNHN